MAFYTAKHLGTCEIWLTAALRFLLLAGHAVTGWHSNQYDQSRARKALPGAPKVFLRKHRGFGCIQQPTKLFPAL
jgi:hypothetical protein